MSTLQFGLFFAALLIGYVLVHIRLVRFEKYLREVSALKVVNERLQGVTDVLSRVDLAAVEERLEMIHGRLGELVEQQSRILVNFNRVSAGPRTSRCRHSPKELAYLIPSGNRPK